MRKLARIFAIATIRGVAACGGHRSPTTPPPVTGGGTGDGGSGGTPPPPPAPPTLKVTKILCFGDSLTEGTVQPPVSFTALDAGASVSYPYKLQTLEAARYTSQTITVWNDGRAGESAEDNTADDNAYDRLTHGLSDTNPDVLLLMEGANDFAKYVAQNPSQNAGIVAVVNAMEDMVRAAQSRGVAVFVATLPPQRPGGLRAGAADLVAPYNTALKAMVAKKGATLVDLNTLFPLSLIGLDGLHPTEDGYEKMAEIFQSALAAAYEVPPAGGSVNARP
jgi:lysophospholipase L1-like esterase